MYKEKEKGEGGGGGDRAMREGKKIENCTENAREGEFEVSLPTDIYSRNITQLQGRQEELPASITLQIFPVVYLLLYQSNHHSFIT